MVANNTEKETEPPMTTRKTGSLGISDGDSFMPQFEDGLRWLPGILGNPPEPQVSLLSRSGCQCRELCCPGVQLRALSTWQIWTISSMGTGLFHSRPSFMT